MGFKFWRSESNTGFLSHSLLTFGKLLLWEIPISLLKAVIIISFSYSTGKDLMRWYAWNVCCIIGTECILCFMLSFFPIYCQFLCVPLTPLSQHRCAWCSIEGGLQAFLKEKVEAKGKWECFSYTKNPLLQGWTFYKQEKGIHGDPGRLKQLYTEEVHTGRRHFL